MTDIHKICQATGQPFVITTAEQHHILKIETLHPLLKSGDIPLPEIHPLELLRQMQSYVTLTTLFDSKSSISGQAQITRYNPQLGYQICTPEEFWSDAVDNTSCGLTFDFSRTFASQWDELLHRVIMQPLVQINCENSPYVDSCSRVKDCYMCFGMADSESCLYCIKSRYPLKSRDCVDCVGIVNCELCYSCIDCDNSYTCQHCQNCRNCQDCFGSEDLVGCRYCFGCFGLRQTEYAIFNQKVTAEQYQEFIKNAALEKYSSRQSQLQKCQEFINGHAPIKSQVTHCENSSGNYLSHCKNAYQCFLGENLEDCGWSIGSSGKDCWRSEVYEGELSYNSAILSGRLGFGNSICTGSENFYSYMIFGSNSCFGSAMLKQKSYCILNKQYTKSAYEALVPQIIAHMKATGEWGKFLPTQQAPHLYEESQAADWFELLTPAQQQSRNYRVANTQSPSSVTHKAEDPLTLPETSTDLPIDQLLTMTLLCPITNKFYRFDQRELVFYGSQSIPLPRIHWQERLQRLLRYRRPALLSVS